MKFSSEQISSLYSGDRRSVFIHRGDISDPIICDELIVLSGSFNPFHKGHITLLEKAEKMSGRTGVFEISIENVDKPRMSREELDIRLSPLIGLRDVIITRSPLFFEKWEQLKGAWFVIGFDTAIRLINDKYYSDNDNWPTATFGLEKMTYSGTKFIVGGRIDNNGIFKTGEDLKIPKSVKDLFIFLNEDKFRVDVSSSQLRENTLNDVQT